MQFTLGKTRQFPRLQMLVDLGNKASFQNIYKLEALT